ncbi:MAG: oligosaccharide flippase family protein, partial [Candidatus Spechtbacterales bacterium]
MLFKIGVNTIAASLGRAVGSVLALFSVALMTRALGVEGFGEYATIIAYLTTFQILADLGLYSLFTREISQSPSRERELLSIFFTLRLLAGAFLLALAVGLVFFFPYSHNVQIGVALASFGFLAISLTQLFMGVFQTRVAVYKAAIAEILGRAAQLGLVAIFFWQGGGLLSFVAALIISSFVIFFANLFFAWRIIPFRLALPLPEARRIMRTAIPIAVSIIFTLLYFRMDTLMLSVMKGPAEVGLYSGAYKVLETFI